jgi:hypothetical protein
VGHATNLFTIRHRKTNRYIEIEDDGTVKAVMTVGTNNYLTLNMGNDKKKENSKSSI